MDIITRMQTYKASLVSPNTPPASTQTPSRIGIYYPYEAKNQLFKFISVILFVQHVPLINYKSLSLSKSSPWSLFSS